VVIVLPVKGLGDIFFVGVDGYGLTPNYLPYNDCLPKIYSHRAMKNFTDRIGCRPESFNWTQINQNPNPSVTNYISNILNNNIQQM